MNAAKLQLIYSCLLVRGIVLVCQLFLVPFPDHHADAFNPPSSPSKSLLDSILSISFRGYRRWDAVYFTFIAHWGYVYEHCVAFFPLLPTILALISRLFHPLLSGWINLDTLILLIGILINQILAVFCTLQLYHLGLSVLHSPHISWLASLLFTINPALIFFSAIYTESLFFLLTLTALRYHEQKALPMATFFIALSIGCRSNGLLNLGYVAFTWWSTCFGMPSRLIWNEEILKNVRSSTWRLLSKSVSWWLTLLIDFSHLLFLLLLGSLPFFTFQFFTYMSFCPATIVRHLNWLVSTISPAVDKSVVDFGIVEKFHFSSSIIRKYGLNQSEIPDWCTTNIPLSYSHVQSTYWQVGFLTYYELKQIPNFVLACPVIVLCVGCAASFYSLAPKAYKTLGLRAETPRDCYLVPHVFHMLFLTVYGITHINVQVLTRMIFSSCPVLYWYCAYLLTDRPPWEHSNPYSKRWPIKANHDGTSLLKDVCGSDNVRLDQIVQLVNPMRYPLWKQRLLLIYFLSYAACGTILHAKFLPWT